MSFQRRLDLIGNMGLPGPWLTMPTRLPGWVSLLKMMVVGVDGRLLKKPSQIKPRFSFSRLVSP